MYDEFCIKNALKATDENKYENSTNIIVGEPTMLILDLLERRRDLLNFKYMAI